MRQEHCLVRVEIWERRDLLRRNWEGKEKESGPISLTALPLVSENTSYSRKRFQGKQFSQRYYTDRVWFHIWKICSLVPGKLLMDRFRASVEIP